MLEIPISILPLSSWGKSESKLDCHLRHGALNSKPISHARMPQKPVRYVAVVARAETRLIWHHVQHNSKGQVRRGNLK